MSERDYTIAAVARAMRVLEALGDKPDQGITELAKELGLTKSLVFRIISTLEARGYVSRDSNKATFSLGYRAATLGERAERQKALMLAAQDEMDLLSEETSENVNLIVRDGVQSLVVGSREGRYSMRLFAQVGRHGPIHAGGGSTLLLAYAPDDIQERVLSSDLAAYTEKTITDPRSNVYAFAYDALNRLIKETDQDLSEVNYTLDGQGNVTAYEDPRNLQTTYVRNGFGEAIRRTSPDTGVSITECPGAMGPDITISYGDGRSKVTNKVKTTSDGKVVIKMMPANNPDNGVDYKTLDITLIGKNAESAWLTRTLNSTESASKKATICVDGKPEGEYEYIVVVPGVGMIDPRVEIEN